MLLKKIFLKLSGIFNMPYIASNGTTIAHATSHDDFLSILIRYLCGVSPSSFSGSGGVRLRYARALVSAAETWTITCTNAGAGTFSVVGSVSGAQSAATVGIAYNNGKIAFTLTNVSGAPVNGDVITIAANTSNLVSAGYAWELIRYDQVGTGSNRVYLRGLGLSGTDQIYVGLFSYQNVGSDYYNIALSGMNGYTESQTTLASAPGSSYSGKVTEVCLLSGTMPFWIIANGRRFMFVVKVSTVYECAYLGFILPTGTPSEYPYPLAIGGSHSVTGRRWSDNQTSGVNGSRHRAFFNPNLSLVVREKGGNWIAFANYSYSSSEDSTPGGANDACTTPFRDMVIARTISGNLVLYPVTLHMDNPVNQVLGDFEGVYMVSGFSNVSENITTISSVDYLTVQNTYRANTGEYAAFKLQ